MGWRFRFESYWPKVEGFLEVVAVVWASVFSHDNLCKVLHEKLGATAKALSSWSARRIGHIKLQIRVAIEVIYILDVAMETRALSEEEISLRRALKRKLLGLSSLKRMIARSKSRLL